MDTAIEMTTERAMEILNPEHREHYESIAPVEEACRMGIKALRLNIPEKIIERNDRDITRLICPYCKAPKKYLYNLSKERNRRCGYCGKALDWCNID